MAAASKRVLVVNGPNLNLLGTREPDVYGSTTLDDIERALQDVAAELGVTVECRQSNQEGQLIDWLHEARSTHDGVLINPGGLTHTSVSLRDAIAAAGLPTGEVHISNIHSRERFRHRSTLSAGAKAVVCGLGFRGYLAALDHIAETG